jgi:predicted acetyltransferase
MLAFALDFCRNIGIKKVLITCLKDNIYSAKTIQSNGGILDSEDMEDGQEFQRYWIKI